MADNVKKWLDIIEVSQKQAYIFGSNKLQDNVINSMRIAYVTRDEKSDEPKEYIRNNFFTSVVKEYVEENYLSKTVYNEDKNFIFSGGGHTILQFEKKEDAILFNQIITEKIRKVIPDIELFVAIVPYDNHLTPTKNLQRLTKKLEEKKAMRTSSFFQRSFGIEKVDVNSLKPEPEKMIDDNMENMESNVRNRINFLDRKLIPDGYQAVSSFNKLGISRDEKSFIAVVHIDGNGMGSRVNAYYEKLEKENTDWTEFCKQIRAFSESIDDDYQKAFTELNIKIAHKIEDGTLDELNLGTDKKQFPLRRVVASGDDICFVCDGRIGIEAAAMFLEELSKIKNLHDDKNYTACAGVAIVHEKYPFFSAYDLAEKLCSRAKKYTASLSSDDNGASISAIDWSLNSGEIKDKLSEIDKDYMSKDHISLTMRPYIVYSAEKSIENYPRTYARFRKLYDLLTSNEQGLMDLRSHLKEMRFILKENENEVRYYVQFHKLDSILIESHDIFETKKQTNIDTDVSDLLYISDQDLNGNEDSSKRCAVLFDAAEIMDTYIRLNQGGEDNGD